MIYKLCEEVWWGNWQAPAECVGQVGTIINVAHSFSRRKGRNLYWANLEKMQWEVLYFRLAKKDRMDIDDKYAAVLSSFVDSAVLLHKFPILTHCQMGGHRGPTSAIFVAWHLAGRKTAALRNLHMEALRLFPRLANGSNYYKSTLAYCEAHSS
jgi:hypothetical protein